MKTIKNLITTLAIFLLFSFFAPQAHAQEASRGFLDTQFSAIAGSLTGIPMDSELGGAVCSSSMSQEKYIIGCNPSPDGNQAVSGLIPAMGNYVALALVSPPISSREYIADLGSNIGLPTVSRAQAQGIGYDVLSPVLSVWKAFRNLAYALYIIVFIVVGVMIMFRTKINAQTIITIQSALPNLLISLILITFSYAIAGLFIDLIYFSIYFLIYLAFSTNIISDPSGLVQKITNENLFSLMLTGKNDAVTVAADSMRQIVTTALGGETSIVSGSGFVGFITRPIAWLILAVAVAAAIFKTLWELIKSYINIVILTVTGPLQLLTNALPGSQAFSSWIRKLAANAAPFPIVAAMLLFGAILMGPATQAVSGGEPNPFNVNEDVGYTGNSATENWVPPFLSFTGVSEDGGVVSVQEAFLALMGIGVILMIPKSAEMARDALQVEQSKYTAEIMSALGTGAQVGGWPVRSLSGAYRQQRAHRQQARLLGDAIDPGTIRSGSRGPTQSDQQV